MKYKTSFILILFYIILLGSLIIKWRTSKQSDSSNKVASLVLSHLSQATTSLYQSVVNKAEARPISTLIYLPLVSKADSFLLDSPIWSHSKPPAPHETVLFRHQMNLESSLLDAELLIFADTRYEIWLDGTWIGRGPARFSFKRREYDRYALGTLPPGEHLITVFVQWAPNTRRSESQTPFLQAHIEGTTPIGSSVVVAQTNSQWQALPILAWRQDAAPVHTSQLIGPTELLDLRELPPDWPTPSNQWSTAVIKSVPWANYSPRSIPLLEQVAIPATVRETGILEEDKKIFEVPPSMTEPYQLSIRALSKTELLLETLQIADTDLVTASLDGYLLDWVEPSEGHPDVRLASRIVSAGDHTLSLQAIPARGLTLALSKSNVDSSPQPFEQGLHAGQRLLLAEPSQKNGAVTILDDNGLNLQFNQTPAYALLDLGRVVHGRIIADVYGAAGTVMDIGWGERLWQDKRLLPFPGSLHKQSNQTDSWILSGNTHTISTIDTRAGRYILIAVWGDGPVYLNNIQIKEERFPVVQKGSFFSSDTRLNAIWQVGVDTLRPNMTDAYTDTPWRERGQWWGDAFVAEHINRVAFSDLALLRRGLIFYADSFEAGRPQGLAPNGQGSNMLDFGMLWVQSLHNYRYLTADDQLVVTLYPVLLEFLGHLEQYENPTTGLLDIPLGHWSQTSLIDWAGADSRDGQSTALNAMYYGTLNDAVAIASAVGDVSHATLWQQKAASIKAAAQTHLYQPQEGRYISSIVEAEVRPASPHAQAWALAYKLVPESEEQRVADALLTLLASAPESPKVEIYGMFWVLEALERTGRLTSALSVIKQYYGRLLDLGATTWWEGFNSHLSHPASLSHAWGGSPTWFLSTYILGGRWLGGNRWQVRPALSDLDTVSGTIPLQTGTLALKWNYSRCDVIRLDLASSPQSEGEIIVPFTDPELELTLNSTIIWQDETPLVDEVSSQEDGIHVALGSGWHTFEIYLPSGCH